MVLKRNDKVLVNHYWKYPNAKEYGIIDWIMEETIVINFGGYTVNILKEDIKPIGLIGAETKNTLSAYEEGIKEGKKKLALELSVMAERKLLNGNLSYEDTREFTLEVIQFLKQTLRDGMS